MRFMRCFLILRPLCGVYRDYASMRGRNENLIRVMGLIIDLVIVISSSFEIIVLFLSCNLVQLYSTYVQHVIELWLSFLVPCAHIYTHVHAASVPLLRVVMIRGRPYIDTTHVSSEKIHSRQNIYLVNVKKGLHENDECTLAEPFARGGASRN